MYLCKVLLAFATVCAALYLQLTGQFQFNLLTCALQAKANEKSHRFHYS